MLNQATGRTGEDIACEYLKKQGYKIIDRNYRIRGGEIDIVAKDKDDLVFIEVKARYSHKFGEPAEAITYFKLKALLKTALFYILKINWGNRPYRIDVVTIDYLFDKSSPKIELIKNVTS